MNLIIQKSEIINQKSSIQITGSKSESNRLLLLQALHADIQIKNLSNSDDSQLMQKALSSKESVIDIHHAGTAMRFLTAYFSIQDGREVVLTGSKRMKERPIKILVDALRSLGAVITYEENQGYPPLRIKGQQIKSDEVSLQANVSSQYISALLLIGSKLSNGLKLKLEGEITSVPYINMTLALLNEIGCETSFIDNVITVKPVSNANVSKTLTVESDWSSASYFYSIVALAEIGTQIELSSYKKDSLQGDSVLVDVYKQFGVETQFTGKQSIILTKVKADLKPVYLDLKNAPDIAQTIAVTCFGLGISCQLQGLHTLKIKETDRLVALKTEIEKLGGNLNISSDSLQLKSSKTINQKISIVTYNDHRMAMAFAPLALKVPIQIKEAEVVSKSYPDFWNDLETLGFIINKK